jgi:hypothetical protein
VADNEARGKCSGDAKECSPSPGGTRVCKEQRGGLPRAAASQPTGNLALDTATDIAESVRGRDQYEAANQLWRVDRELQRNAASRRDTDEVDRTVEQVSKGDGIFVGEIAEQYLLRHAAPAVDTPHRSAVRKLDDFLILHPCGDAERDPVSTGQARDDDEGYARPQLQVGK